MEGQEALQQKAHYVAVTCIIQDKDKYLICRRSPTEKAFPGKWCVPGGKLELKEYAHLPKQTKDHWLDILEREVAREVREETGLEIKHIEYVSNLVFIRPNGFPTLIISLSGQYAGGTVRLDQDELVDHAWVTLDQAREYDLIENILEQMEKVEKKDKKKT